MSDPSPALPGLPELPAALRRVLPAARWERTDGHSGAAVWRSSRYVLKVQPRASQASGQPGPESSRQESPALASPPHESLRHERERLRWLAGRVPVPAVVGFEVTAGHEFLAMTRVPGVPMSDPDALLHPERVTDLLARALRELHALPLRECPFRMTLDVTLRLARERVAAGLVDESDFDAEPWLGARLGRTATSVFNELVRSRPAREDLVVTHGDACLPNFIVDGEYVAGLIDVGRAGIADRHADLALAWRSLRRNLGPELGPVAAEAFLDRYGRALVDPHKLAYYCLLDELF